MKKLLEVLRKVHPQNEEKRINYPILLMPHLKLEIFSIERKKKRPLSITNFIILSDIAVFSESFKFKIFFLCASVGEVCKILK